MTNANCSEIREMLQEAHDRGAEPDAACLAHLDGCTECRAFSEYLSSFPARLANALDERVSRRNRPAFAAISAGARSLKRRRRIAYSLSGLAAGVIVGLGTMLAVSTFQRVQVERIVREENSRFVDDLFNDSAFEGIEYLTVSQ